MKYKILALAFLASACSVQADREVSTPPNFNNVQKLGTEYGKVGLTSVSIFLWPDMLSSVEAVKLYSEVATSAAQSDQLELQRQKTQVQLDALNSNGFDYSACFKNFEQSCSTTPPVGLPSCDDVQLNNDTIQNWVYASIDQVPTDEMKKLFSACRDFTNTKVNLKTNLDKLTTSGLDLTAKILYRIDPAYQKTGIQTNYKSFKNPNGSSITLTQAKDGDKVELRFDGFADNKNYQSNVAGVSTCESKPAPAEFQIYDVIYSHENRSLSFRIPEILGCQATGGVYAFSLERNDFGGNPRFSGDVIYTKAGISKNGSAKFDGQF